MFTITLMMDTLFTHVMHPSLPPFTLDAQLLTLTRTSLQWTRLRVGWQGFGQDERFCTFPTTLRFDMVSYTANCSNPFKAKGHNSLLGHYNTAKEAEIAYKKAKYGYMLDIADLQTDSRVKTALIRYYDSYKEAYYE